MNWGKAETSNKKMEEKQLEKQKRQKTEAKQIPPKIVPFDCFCLLCCPQDFFWVALFFLFIFICCEIWFPVLFICFCFFACILFQETDLYNVAGSCWNNTWRTRRPCARKLYLCLLFTWQMGHCMLVNTLSWQFGSGAVVTRMRIVKGLPCLSPPTKGLNGNMHIRAIEIVSGVFGQTVSRASCWQPFVELYNISKVSLFVFVGNLVPVVLWCPAHCGALGPLLGSVLFFDFGGCCYRFSFSWDLPSLFPAAAYGFVPLLPLCVQWTAADHSKYRSEPSQSAMHRRRGEWG